MSEDPQKVESSEIVYGSQWSLNTPYSKLMSPHMAKIGSTENVSSNSKPIISIIPKNLEPSEEISKLKYMIAGYSPVKTEKRKKLSGLQNSFDSNLMQEQASDESGTRNGDTN